MSLPFTLPAAVPGLGTLANTGAIIICGFLGTKFGDMLPQRCRETLMLAAGMAVFLLGVSGSIGYMIDTSHLHASLLLTLSLAAGALLGELINIEAYLEALGRWLKRRVYGLGADTAAQLGDGKAADAAADAQAGAGKTVAAGNTHSRGRFVEGFVEASLVVCVGAMAIVGSLEDGLVADASLLYTKSIMDALIIFVMASQLGIGCAGAALPVALLQGSVTMLAHSLNSLITPEAVELLSFVGSALIACVGINLVWHTKIRVANMLPALAVALLLGIWL